MDLTHELCPAQLLEVTKKSDILSVWLASIQHLAHIRDWSRRHLLPWDRRCFACTGAWHTGDDQQHYYCRVRQLKPCALLLAVISRNVSCHVMLCLMCWMFIFHLESSCRYQQSTHSASQSTWVCRSGDMTSRCQAPGQQISLPGITALRTPASQQSNVRCHYSNIQCLHSSPQSNDVLQFAFITFLWTLNIVFSGTAFE